MIPKLAYLYYIPDRIPRESGDDPPVLVAFSTGKEYSPRERG